MTGASAPAGCLEYGPGLTPSAGEGMSFTPDETFARHDGCPFQNIAQLPHIAGPIVDLKKIQHFAIDPAYPRAVLLVQILQHDIGDRRDILFMFPQRRNYDLKYTQPVVKLLAQMRFEVLTGGRKYAGVYRDFVLTAKPPHSQVFENAQQLRLGRWRHLADFVQKQRAAVGLLKATGGALHGARKRAFLVAEQLALNQSLR